MRRREEKRREEKRRREESKWEDRHYLERERFISYETMVFVMEKL